MKTRNKVEKPIEDFLYAVENKTVRNQAHSQIMQKELTGILDSLSDDYKVPFLMFFQGYHYDEIAEHMNLPIGTVKSRIFYARKQLKDMINQRYETTNVRA